MFSSDENIEKVELLPGLRNTTKVHDLFDCAFYCFVKANKEKEGVDIKLSEDYECEKKQIGFKSGKDGVDSHFSIKDKKVYCHSGRKEIWIEKSEPYKLELKNKNIFEEFEKAFEYIKKDLFG